jgi:uncharacterized membrane protein YfcA
MGRIKKQVSREKKTLGYILLAITFLILGVFSSGVGVLINMVLMGLMGMSVLEANVAKRYGGLVLNAVIAIGVLFSGLIVWQVVAVSVVGSLVGGCLGAHVALRKGDECIGKIFAILMLLSGFGLLVR